MDIKLKDNKKFSFLTAVLLILAAAIGYFMMYPSFQKQAEVYYVDPLNSHSFLYKLYQGSCVLYKDITEAAEERTVEYADLYRMTADQLILEGVSEKSDQTSLVFWDETFGSVEMWEQESRERINSNLLSWREEILDGLAKDMDYCVIHNDTGKSIKNTGRDLEKLATEGADAAADYVWYVMVSFDSAGNAEMVAVKGNQADTLLKNVQIVMQSNDLSNDFWKGVGGYSALYSDGSIYFHDGDNNVWKEKTVIFNTPRNITSIFALTMEQQEKLLDDNSVRNGMGASRAYNEWHAYDLADTGETMNIFLCVLAVLALAVTRLKKYCLHTLEGVKLHAEVALFAMLIMLSASGEYIIYLVNYTNRGRFGQVFHKIIPWLSTTFYPVLTAFINILILFLVFALWYYLATAFGELFVLGFKEFLKERSLLWKNWDRISRFFKRNAAKLKEEVLHVDLGESANKTIRKLVIVNFLLLAAVNLMWVFGWGVLIPYSIVLYIGLKKYVGKIQEQYKKLFDATRSIAEGNLETQLEQDWGVFESYKAELARIQDGFKRAVEKEVRSQKMKTELITNVSHDLKTPLTAITTYVELLETENITPEERNKYLLVLKKKTQRLKVLIEDLFEISKASTGNIVFDPVDMDICNLLRQVYLEYEEQIGEAELTFRFSVPEEKVILRLDSQKTYRIFENLYINIIKYAMPHTRVYVNVHKIGREVWIELKNMSAAELNILPEDLTERFVRGDSSRNTEGSGLGLAIAENFVELQGGRMIVEIDGDLFKVTIVF